MKKPVGIEWTQRAIADLDEIAEFIGRDDADAAARWERRLIERVEAIAAAPRSGRKVPEFGRDDLREVLLKSYRLVYLVQAERITIVTVIEGHRLLPPLTLSR